MQLDTKSLDDSLEYFRRQVNDVTVSNTENPQRNFFHTLLEPPYLYMIITYCTVFVFLLYTQPGFVMNETVIPVFEIDTQEQSKSQLHMNYSKLFLYSFIISAIVICGYYGYQKYKNTKDDKII